MVHPQECWSECGKDVGGKMFNPDVVNGVTLIRSIVEVDYLHFGANDAFYVDECFVDLLESAFPDFDLEFFPTEALGCICGAEGGGVGGLFRCNGFGIAFSKVEVFVRKVDTVEEGRVEICHFFCQGVRMFRLIDKWRWWNDIGRRRSQPWSRLAENRKKLAFTASDIQDLWGGWLALSLLGWLIDRDDVKIIVKITRAL